MIAELHQLVHLFDAMPLPVRIMDAACRPLHDTPPLQRLLVETQDGHRLREALDDAARATAASAGAPTRRELQTEFADYRLYASRLIAGLAGGDGIVVGVERTSRTMLTVDEMRNRFRLTPRETEIACMLAAGMPNDEIATTLGRSPYTVRRHTEHVLSKLGVRRRAQVSVRLLYGGHGDRSASM
jgi:DNA-binding CsgD family transcriptional regulator